mmetsp:Transcript_13522/g.25375  ORF Transcript_13522/g.25375 Transcript_13522/m.25375 type:complete len:774 (+) Transcript_13522:140-2461(+)
MKSKSCFYSIPLLIFFCRVKIQESHAFANSSSRRSSSSGSRSSLYPNNKTNKPVPTHSSSNPPSARDTAKVKASASATKKRKDTRTSRFQKESTATTRNGIAPRKKQDLQKFKREGLHIKYDLTEKQLCTQTNQLLDSCGENGEMTLDKIQLAEDLILTWSKRPFSKSAGEMSERLLQKLILEKECGNPHAKPSIHLFNCCMNCWLKSDRVNGYRKALDWLKDLNVYVQTHTDIPAEKEDIAKCYGTAIDGCCRVKSRISADLALELLEKMDSGRDIKYFNAVMNAYATLYDHESVLKIFQRMKSMRDSGEIDFGPNRTSYNIVIKSLSGSNEMDCIRRAESILSEMESAYSNGDRLISPDKISYTTVLSAWSKICNKEAVEKAEMYLERMHKMANEGNTEVKPDCVTYNTILNVIANSKSIDSGERSLKILNRMEELYELGDADVKPNLISYNAVIKSFSNNPYNDGARRALMMLKKLESDDDIKPDIISYNSCLKAFARAGDPISAQSLLDRMESLYTSGHSVKPDTYSYNTVISAWAFSGHDHGAEIAETIFDRMETSDIRMDTTTFNTLLSAWGRQKDPDRATDILHHMFAVKKSGKYDVTPTSQSFAIVMNAWAKSRYPRKAFKAKQLLEEMKERSKYNEKLKPNVYIYASILNACAFSYGSPEIRGEAIIIATEVFKECKHRNDVIYGTFMKACNSLMEHDDTRRAGMIEAVFRECREKGYVSDFVLQELFSSLPPERYQKLLGCDAQHVLSTRDIAKEWRRNITKI